jgi:hypothetical protein
MKSMFDLKLEYAELLAQARTSFDPETGELTDEEADERIDLKYSQLSGEIEEKVVGTSYVVLRLKAEEDSIKEEIDRLRARKARLRRGADRLKDRLRDFMAETGTKKVDTVSLSVTLGKPSKTVQILNEAEIPEEFMVIPEPKPYPDKKAIAKALKNPDTSVPGAVLTEGKHRLLIR